MPKQIIAIIIFCSITKSYSQFDGSLFSFNYTLAPIGSDDFDFYKTSINFNVPIKLKKGILINSFGVNHYELNYENSMPFTTDDLNEFNGFKYSLMYVYPINDKWNVSGRLGVSAISNFTSGLSSDDLLFNSGAFVSKKGGTKEKPSRLMLGVGYSAISGKPRILPLISYTKKVSDKFSYGIGFPNLFAKYNMNERSSLKTSIWMNGFYANLSNPVVVDTYNEAEKASLTAISLGLEYEYWMDKFWAITFKTGYSMYNKYELEDVSKNIVYEFEAGSKPYFSTGVKFSLSKLFNKNKNDK